jgi:NADPH:quinone reductase-like Zn-dependent oxidoreductase
LYFPLKDDEVDVDVEFVGLQASGHTLSSIKYAVGEVVRKGSDCAELSSCQRVVIFTKDAAITRLRQSSTLIAPLPEGIEPEEAIALIELLIAAQYALIEVARLL